MLLWKYPDREPERPAHERTDTVPAEAGGSQDWISYLGRPVLEALDLFSPQPEPRERRHG